MMLRLVRAPLLLVGVSVLVYAATEALPGDAADARTAGRATAAQLAKLRTRTGLDAPAWQRYLDWAGGLLRGDAGVSLLSDRPVADLVGQRLPATATLAAAALAAAVPAMLALAWIAGTPSRTGRIAAAAVTAAAAVPQVVVAAGLTAVFAGMLAWLPPVSLLPPGGTPADPRALTLPVLSLAVPSATYGAALLRGVVADAAARPYVRDAHLRGLPRWRVAAVYVGPMLLAPAARVVAVVAGGLVASTAVVETLFGYAGLGELLTGAVANRDTPVVQAVAMLAAAVVLAGLFLADLLAAATDARRSPA
ncbi:peptide/nickel transport system permease protein [Micromonospora viridifaciens]|uniref:Peptide/nickel transport system permease protein n=1 Tax=Micromonospora viridifaciens TaxID=1881 RepID=A0A1C4WIW4_MICVI|nr:ABC transporter permease subunit [Micromonospora viridifaciens]SCE96140.1 peptide/nickel transport system permease protein [Micromonospora viridifaciens]